MPRAKHKYHYLYKTTNLINNKYYYGMHSTSNLNDEYLGSGKRLRYSIRKYGKENFKLEIIKFYKDKDELIQAEKNLITEDIIKESLCMNLKPGGSGGWSVEQQQINGKNSKIKQDILRKTDIVWVKHKANALSISHKKLYDSGKRTAEYFYDWTGKQHDEETKIKIGLSNKENHIGEKNGSYGTCWITKNNINKKIKKEELNTFLLDDWIKGRICKN